MSGLLLELDFSDITKRVENFKGFKLGPISNKYLELGGQQVVNTIKRGMSQSRGGRSYRRRSVVHESSTRGNMPAVDSGRLLSSIFSESNNSSLIIGSNMIYASALENPDNLNRPFLLPALEQHKESILQNIIDDIEETFT